MPMLFIKCPKTQKDIPTGIDVPKDMDRSGISNNSISCSECGQMHTWDGKDAFFK